ncbi:hypothetical protein P153DRAFT_380980 [Dothidotthia symphoricarpi CBS 119687]|uniref:Uncharacterized protein n=1 Tax=Dothidotthia symphoricarpi CBS 119687 TaxID=1392245 RepID=A0A6A6AS95_9PLEO|nr:uncharacterized protein P153DRAFT_380980 [Dothidotthia symphoricarpi CBS 119687]KAF2133804.1 hypothetical protein P153DRAFT_380980 [Dothidotthia symphoricarpi CBS 119687]
MSLVISNAGRLKPEIRLAEAVSQFKSSLSTDQKMLLDANTSQAMKNTPTPSDVMRFTAEFNRRVSSEAGGRCYGPRLANFLQGVQQFAALGDVVVGGSQNMIACGVWSLVRMSLLATINISSYLESLSLLFMEVGRSVPRNQAIALLYPQSRNLQAHMSEYFIVVVKLCHKLMSFVQKSAFQRLTTALGDMDLKTFRTELDLWSGLIKDEMGLQVAQRIESEACDNSRFRTLSKNFSTSFSQDQKRAKKLRILDLCSQYDYGTTWKQIRKIGNTHLFTKTADYQTWKTSVESCTLVFTGRLGSGKSVMMANMVEDLNVHTGGAKSTAAYFFCKHDLPESLKARTIIGALVRQVLQPLPDLPSLKETKYGSLDYEDMLELLRHALPRRHLTYFVLDGLDLCDESEKEEVFPICRLLQKVTSVLICITYRLEPNITLGSLHNRFIAPQVVPLPDNQSDIETFIQAELERCLERRVLNIGEPRLILDIQDALSKGSQGMFL